MERERERHLRPRPRHGSTASIGRPPIRRSCDSATACPDSSSSSADESGCEGLYVTRCGTMFAHRGCGSKWPDGRGRTRSGRGRQGDLGAPAPHRERRGPRAGSGHHDHRGDPARRRGVPRCVVRVRVSKWSTESRLDLAQAATARTEANRANVADVRSSDGDGRRPTPGARRTLGNQRAVALAVRRFRPEYHVAFDASSLEPETNPNAPPGPTYMPEYRQPGAEQGEELDGRANGKFEAGPEAGANADDYVRMTVYLAIVLFLVAISGHFRVRGDHRAGGRRRGGARHRGGHARHVARTPVSADDLDLRRRARRRTGRRSPLADGRVRCSRRWRSRSCCRTSSGTFRCGYCR